MPYCNYKRTSCFLVLSGGGLLNHNVVTVQDSEVDDCQPYSYSYSCKLFMCCDNEKLNIGGHRN